MLQDFNLDRRIAQLIQTVEAAFADHETAQETIQTAHETISRSEKSAVKGAWSLGKHLIEKKRRLPHGAWEQWLATTDISLTTAKNYMTMASQIVSADDLKPSIRHRFGQQGSNRWRCTGRNRYRAPSVPQASRRPHAAWLQVKRQCAVGRGRTSRSSPKPRQSSIQKKSSMKPRKLRRLRRTQRDHVRRMADPSSRETYRQTQQSNRTNPNAQSVGREQLASQTIRRPVAQFKALKRRNKALEAAAAKSSRPGA